MYPEHYGVGQTQRQQNFMGQGIAPFLMTFDIEDLAGDADISGQLLASAPAGYDLTLLEAGIAFKGTYAGAGTAQVETATVVSPGVAQVETATVVGTIEAAGAGNAAVIVTAAGMAGSPKTKSVAVANNDNAAAVAGKIAVVLAADTDIAAMFTVTNPGSGATVVLTAKTAAANDGTLNVSIDNGTCAGLTTAASSANSTAGVAPGITTSGNGTVTVTAAGMTGSPKAISVALVAGDVASAVATKIKAALTADTAVSGMFTVGGTGATVTLTRKIKAANDGTLNIALIDDTCAGITTAASSANTTAGVAQTTSTITLKNGANTALSKELNDTNYPATETYFSLGTVVEAYKKVASLGSLTLDVTNAGAANPPAMRLQLLVCLDQAFV
jgi:hypothetical protein